jgi:hypothetical protein
LKTSASYWISALVSVTGAFFGIVRIAQSALGLVRAAKAAGTRNEIVQERQVGSNSMKRGNCR